ncbi:MAG: DMT family transporter [Rhodobacteraceae bacterium]|nr:DMT family transporter [Paracoccaceae bacterium]
MQYPPIQAQSSAMRGAVWMFGAVASFTVMALAGRAAVTQLDTFEIMLYRSLMGIVIVMGIATARGQLSAVRVDRLPLHFARNIAHFAGQNLWFFALASIPLAQVFALEFTTPIWVILLAPFIVKERITAIGLVAAALGFIGIMLIADPDPANLSAPIIAAAAAAVFFALTALFTRRLTQNQSVLTILIWLTIMQAGFALICAGYDGQIALPNRVTLPYLVLIGCAGLTAHFCLTKALSLAPASIVMPIDFVRLPIIAVLGMLFYDEPLNGWIFIGAVLIFSGNWPNMYYSNKNR